MFRGFVAELGGDPNAPSPRPDVGPFSGQRASSADAQQAAAAAPEATGPFSQERPPSDEVVYVRPYQPPADLQLPPGHEQLVAALNSDIGREYTTVLQYLFQSFVHKSNRLGKELQLDLAQWHMKHWGWMAERIAELGGEVTTRHADIDRTRDAATIIRNDLDRQRLLSDHYADEMQTLDDETARTFLRRIQAHDAYQVGQLEDLLPAAESGEFGAADAGAVSPVSAPEPDASSAGTPPSGPRFTVGDLFGRKQGE
jgi:bacterioferritin (cytochrome b1)